MSEKSVRRIVVTMSEPNFDDPEDFESFFNVREIRFVGLMHVLRQRSGREGSYTYEFEVT